MLEWHKYSCFSLSRQRDVLQRQLLICLYQGVTEWLVDSNYLGVLG